MGDGILDEFNKFKVRVPKSVPKTSDLRRSKRELASEYVRMVGFADGLSSMLRMAVMELINVNIKREDQRQQAFSMLEGSLGVAIDSHRGELEEALVGDMCDKYDDEELEALVSFHGSRIGRQIASKNSSGSRTKLVMMQIDRMAKSLLDGIGKNEKEQVIQ